MDPNQPQTGRCDNVHSEDKESRFGICWKFQYRVGLFRFSEMDLSTSTWTANKCGNVQVKAVANADNAVPESDYGNNELTATVSIKCPSGSLTVTIYPAEVRTQAAIWRLTSGSDTSWHSSGDTISNIPVDSYTIQFNDVTGWTKPSDMAITINEGPNSESGTYTSEGEVDAEFYAISSWPEGVYKPRSVIQPTVWVKNTGDVTHEFFVSMYIENWDNPKKNYTTYESIIVMENKSYQRRI